MKKDKTFVHNFILAGVSGALSKTIITPIENLKLMKPQFVQNRGSIYLYSLKNSCYFSVNEHIKRLFDKKQENGLMKNFVSGWISGCLCRVGPSSIRSNYWYAQFFRSSKLKTSFPFVKCSLITSTDKAIYSSLYFGLFSSLK